MSKMQAALADLTPKQAKALHDMLQHIMGLSGFIQVPRSRVLEVLKSVGQARLDEVRTATEFLALVLDNTPEILDPEPFKDAMDRSVKQAGDLPADFREFPLLVAKIREAGVVADN